MTALVFIIILLVIAYIYFKFNNQDEMAKLVVKIGIPLMIGFAFIFGIDMILDYFSNLMDNAFDSIIGV